MVSSTESAGRQRDGLQGDFAQAVSPLADGELGFPPPFDLSSSAALADNIDLGAIAEQLFSVTAKREMGYSIVIAEHSEQHPEMPAREVMNTTVTSQKMLIAVLSALLDELEEQQSRKEI